MHPLQQHILQQLIFNETQRYSQLKPAAVESNLFVYHLRQLMADGLVAKLDSGLYTLTPSGQAYADRLSLKSFRPRLQPRIVTLVMIKRHDGAILLYRRKRQPLLGMVGFPYGKVHVGEAVAEAAKRELKEKAGLEALMAHRADGYISMSHNGVLVSQILFHLFVGSEVYGRLKGASKSGQPFWALPEEVPVTELMPSVVDLMQADGQSEGRFFFERSYQLETTTPNRLPS